MTVGDRGKKAYVEHSQLKYCWSEPEHYKPNTELVATVLYVLPQSDLVPIQKPVYLTLKDSTERVEPTITIGATVQAVVSIMNISNYLYIVNLSCTILFY